MSRTPAWRSSCSTLNAYSKAAPSHVQVPWPVPTTIVCRVPARILSMAWASRSAASIAWPAVHTERLLPSGPSPGVAAKLSFGPVALTR